MTKRYLQNRKTGVFFEWHPSIAGHKDCVEVPAEVAEGRMVVPKTKRQKAPVATQEPEPASEPVDAPAEDPLDEEDAAAIASITAMLSGRSK